MNILLYIFEPLPSPVGYDQPKVQILLLVCGILVIASFALRIWRKHLTNGVTRKLTRSWPTALLWFGMLGLVLVISRTEDVSILSMRFLWVIWGAAIAAFVFLQWKIFRARHYETLPSQQRNDPRERYLPKPRKRGS